MSKTKAIIATLIIMSMSFGVVVYAGDQAARLKAGLENDYLYYSVGISELHKEQEKDKKAFKTEYDDKYVVISGEIKSDSITSNGKKIILYEPETQQSTEIDSSSKNIVNIVNTLSSGDIVTVFGKLSVTGFSNDNYEIVAKSINNTASVMIPIHSYAFVDGNIYSGSKVSDLTSDNRVVYYIPSTWQNKYVKSVLNNNGVKGYQYSLNSISPQNTDYPENFYIFYFNYETYLEKLPNYLMDGDKEEIEKVIIRNILQNLSDDFKVSISDMKDSNGVEMDYYATTYRPKDGKDYKLEFVFKPDEKGIVCMLYLYYPMESAVRHVDDVVYVIETMEIK